MRARALTLIKTKSSARRRFDAGARELCVCAINKEITARVFFSLFRNITGVIQMSLNIKELILLNENLRLFTTLSPALNACGVENSSTLTFTAVSRFTLRRDLKRTDGSNELHLRNDIFINSISIYMI